MTYCYLIWSEDHLAHINNPPPLGMHLQIYRLIILKTIQQQNNSS